MRLRELEQKAAQILTEARAYQDRREKAGDFNAEDRANVDKMLTSWQEVKDQAAQEKRLLDAERELAQQANEAPPEHRNDGQPAGQGEAEYRYLNGKPMTLEVRRKLEDGLRRYIRSGVVTPEMSEYRALEEGDEGAGGVLVPEQTMSARLLKKVDDAVFIRRFATVETLVGAQSLGYQELVDPSDYEWTSELKTGNFDSTMAFTKRELKPNPLAKKIKVSNRLLANSSRDVIDLVDNRFAYKYAITMEKAYLTGSGYNQPLGAFVASSDGINTDRDHVAGTSTALTADLLKSAKYTLKGAYHGNARWLFHRDGVRRIALLREDTGAGAGTGSYMFDVETGRFMNLPLDMSEYVPNTFNTGLYVGMLADWRTGYTIVDSLQRTMQRLNELYAEANQVGFISRYEGDGMPVQPEAFVRLKLA